VKLVKNPAQVALVELLKELESRLADHGLAYEWQDIKRGLSALQQIDVELNGEPWALRTELRGCCNEVLKAAGVVVPQRVQSR